METATLKVILVDDETLVRVGLKSLASWSENGFEIVAEASNGEEGLNLVQTCRPHLLITDIMMPKLNGIELIRQARAFDPSIKILVLSSYDDYNLVREAMKLGASDYLLKLNINRESLDEVLAKVKTDILSSQSAALGNGRPEMDQQSRIAAQQDFLKDVIGNLIFDREYLDFRLANLGLALRERCLQVAILETNMNAVESIFSEDQDIQLLDFVLEKIVTEIANEFFDSVFLKWAFGTYLIVFSNCGPDPAAADPMAIRQQIGLMSRTIIDMVKKYANLESSISVSSPCVSYLELPEAYSQARRVIGDLFYQGFGQVIFNDEYPIEANIVAGSFGEDISADFIRALQLSDAGEIRRLLAAAQSAIRSQHTDKQYIYSFCSLIAHLSDYYLGPGWKEYKITATGRKLLAETLLSQKTVADILACIDVFTGALTTYLASAGSKNSHALITKAKKYIADNRYKMLSLTEVADYLGISASYLSGLFPKFSGMPFTEYVNKIKIAEAQKLIRRGELKIYEISYRLGYENACYFSKIFKKIVGCTPTEYWQNTAQPA